jgi:hypothetical protein
MLTGFEPNDQMAFEAWSVRVRMPRPATGGTYGFVVRERLLRSRLIGLEERKVIAKVIAKWNQRMRERGGIGSFERVEMGRERANVRERSFHESSFHARMRNESWMRWAVPMTPVRVQ